jgi:CheY-like chemotaxis protein
MSNWHVLVVEDDPDGQEVVSRILRHHKMTVDVAPTGEDAITMLAAIDYSLAVIDLSLPRIDGWRVLESIQTTPRTAQLPCVAVTAFHSADVAVKAIQAGFTAYFPKPLDPTSFVQELQSIVN